MLTRARVWRLLAWGPVVAWMAIIFALSSRPRVPGLDRWPDILTHGIGYLVLCVLVANAMSLGSWLGWWRGPLAVAVATLYGVSDEFHQAFVPGRHSDPWDVGKDALGAVLGALAYRWIAGWRGRDAGP